MSLYKCLKSSYLAIVLVCLAGLSACGGGDDSNASTSLTDLDCAGAVAFDPVAAGLVAPTITPATGAVKNTTIILIHGKASWPGASF